MKNRRELIVTTPVTIVVSGKKKQGCHMSCPFQSVGGRWCSLFNPGIRLKDINCYASKRHDDCLKATGDMRPC